MCSAPLDALWCLWDTMSVLLCSRPTSSPAIQCQHHQRPQDKMWSCYQIKIMSPSLQHATPFSRPVTYSLFLIRSYLLFAGSKHTSIDRPRYIAWHMPRNFATSKVLCLHQIVRIKSHEINCASWIRRWFFMNGAVTQRKGPLKFLIAQVHTFDDVSAHLKKV